MPFQSNDELRIASMKSPLGKWSVHWRWPWKPAGDGVVAERLLAETHFRQARDCRPSGRARSCAIFTNVSHSLSVARGIVPHFRRIVVLAFLAIRLHPARAPVCIPPRSKILSSMRRTNSVMSIVSTRMPR